MSTNNIFIKYPEINNLSNDRIEKTRYRIDNKIIETDDFIVTEKIHGSNFSFYCDGASVYCAKRGGLLVEGLDFNNWPELLNKYRSNILDIYHILEKKYTKPSLIVVYGELCGGLYPHPDIKPDKKVKHIQKGIYYSPEHLFIAFDIYVDQIGFLDWDETVAILSESNTLSNILSNTLLKTPTLIYIPKILKRGPFNDVIDFDVENLATTVPTMLGLPIINDNIAEGVVIRSAKKRRTVIKKKCTKFAEVSGLASIMKRTKAKKDNIDNVDNDVNSQISLLVDSACCYINQNRLQSVLSKESNISKIPTMKLVGLLVKDAMNDFSKDHETYELLDRDIKRKINRQVNNYAANIVNEYLKNNKQPN